MIETEQDAAAFAAASSRLAEGQRRLDDREFKVTSNALYEVCAAQSAHAVRTHAFDPHQVAAQLTDDSMAKRGLPIPHGVTVHTAKDGSSFWAVRRTVSGWWLGRGLTLNELGFVDVWYLSGADQPVLGPSEAQTSGAANLTRRLPTGWAGTGKSHPRAAA